MFVAPNNIFVPSPIAMGFFGISYRLGSDYEAEGCRGTHHLMEHLMYNSFKHLWPKLSRLAVQHNAYTDTDRLGFFFEGLDDSLVQVVPELFNMITSGNCHWTREQFDIEKATVLQEYQDIFNDQYQGTLVNSFRRLYRYFDPIGLWVDVETFSYEDSIKFAECFKHPAFICQVAPGDQRMQYLDCQTKGIVGLLTLGAAVSQPKFGTYDVPLEPVPKKGKTIVGLISKHPISRGERNRVGMVVKCLNDGLESPLVDQIQIRNGLSYFSDGTLYAMHGWNALSFFAITTNKKRKKLRKIYTDFFSGDLTRHISRERFDDCMAGTAAMKRVCDLLPHSSVKMTVMEDSPFTGLEGFAYEDALALLNLHFKLDNFAEIDY